MADLLPPAVESELRLGVVLSVAHVAFRNHSVVVVVRPIVEDHQESDEQLWEVVHVIDSRAPSANRVRELVEEMLRLGAKGVIEADLRRPSFISPGARFRSQRHWLYETTTVEATFALRGMTPRAYIDVPWEKYPVVVGELSERQSWRRDRGQR